MRLFRDKAPIFSREQLTDAAGTYGDVAKREGVLFDPTGTKLHGPSFKEIKRLLGGETPGGVASLKASEVAALSRLPYTRVMVGVVTEKGPAFLPGIVLPDSTTRGTRFGCLRATEDARPGTQADAIKPLSSFQQVLLAKFAAEHQPKVGEHDRSGSVNGADIGHAVVAASLQSGAGIHGQVHGLVSGGALSQEVSRLGVTDMRIDSGRIRKNLSEVLTPQQIGGVYIVEAHQIPFPVTNDFEVSAGFTLAAQQSRGQAPDLARNLAGMAS